MSGDRYNGKNINFPERSELVSCALCFGLFGCSVLLDVQTEAKTDTRTLQVLKPKPNPKTKKTNISVRFRSGRFLVYGLKVPT